MSIMRTCNDCMEKRKGDCVGSKKICDEFRLAPNISQEIRDGWPKYGDATTIRRGGHTDNKPTNSSARRSSLASSVNRMSTTINTITSSQTKILNLVKEETNTKQTIRRISYTYFELSHTKNPLKKITVVFHREKGIAVKMDGVDIKCIAIEPIRQEELESIFKQLDNINFPSQHIFNVKVSAGYAWELNVDGIKYSGYCVTPKFIADIEKIISFSTLQKKYNLAFEEYLKNKAKNS